MARLRVAVFGYIVRGPLGGLAWHHLQYIMGLIDLGHEVMFFEDSEDYPSCYDPRTFSMTSDPSFGVKFLRDSLGDLELQQRWSYYDWHTDSWLGVNRSDALKFLGTADVLLNLSGTNPLRQWSSTVPVRVFVDTDPVFTQIKQLQDSRSLSRAESHNRFLTFGENLFASTLVPTDRFSWKSTRQPIHLPSWRNQDSAPRGPYTTVMQWVSYPAVEFKGQRFGMKSDSFSLIEDTPRRVVPKLQIALGGAGAPSQRLRRRGWSIVSSLRKSTTPSVFRDYVMISRAEFTIAKHGYVVSKSGWFSERSANYLASGRPVITQDTGFSDVLPTGEGLFAFSTLDEAVAAFETVESNYERHCKAAREIADEFFDARKVLGKLLDDVMST